MTEGVRALVNPAMLVWARNERGYTPEEAAKKIRISTEKLLSCESERAYLTFPQLRRAAWVYRRPSAVFFLDEVPRALEIPLFRRLPERQARPLSPELRLQVRTVRQKRKAAINLAEYGPKYDWKSVGSLQVTQAPEEAASSVRQMLAIPDTFPIGLTDYQVFSSWRKAIESTGTLVFLVPGVPIEEMRGFSISEKPFPVVAVNRGDSIRPRSFTLLHEFCHNLLGESSMCEISYEHETPDEQPHNHEVFCNHVAGAVLVPSSLLLSTPTARLHGPEEEWSDRELKELASRFKVSVEVILRRLLVLDHTTPSFYSAKRKEWLSEIRQERKGTPRELFHERVLRTDGLTYTSMVLEALHGEAISAADVSEFLGMDLKHLSSLEKIVSEKGQ